MERRQPPLTLAIYSLAHGTKNEHLTANGPCWVNAWAIPQDRVRRPVLPVGAVMSWCAKAWINHDKS
jgi:hypothetical protein